MRAVIYKFKSRASGDVIMLGPHGDQLLQLAGRGPSAQGIFEVADMPAVIERLQAAIAAEELPPDDDEGPRAPVALRQRLWPMVEMLRRCHAADEPVVWGV